ncbi:efflux RND transporter periplasmic adaptor subunit [Hydrogenimonas sp.]
MKKMTTLIFACLLATTMSLAADQIVKAQGTLAKTAPIEETDRVYLGSFLAIGHLPADAIYRIDAPVEGIVQSLEAKIYQPAKKGQPLLQLKSPKLLEIEATYIDALIQKEYYESEARRLKPLYEAAVVAKKRYLEALNTLAKYKTQSDFYANLLMEWGLSRKQVEAIRRTKKPSPAITLYAPASGQVSDLNIHPKMYLEQGAHILTIIDPSHTHYEVALPKAIAKRLAPGTKIFAGDMAMEVESVSSMVDPRTQTVSVHLLPSRELEILPGEKRNIRLFLPERAFVLPASAVVEIDGAPAIFVKTSEGFRLTPVTILSRGDEKVYLLAGALKKGDEVAIGNVITLKGALEAQGDD